MRFGPVPLEGALGKILAHNVGDGEGRRVLRKGLPVDRAMLDVLRALGVKEVYVAELEPADVHEDEAARRVARGFLGPGLRASAPHLARVNVSADVRGVLRVDPSRLLLLNEIPGITVATLASGSVVRTDNRVATIKVLPYSLPEGEVAKAEEIAASGHVLRLHLLVSRDVALVLVGGAGAEDRRLAGLRDAVSRRVEALGSRLTRVLHVPAEVEAIGVALREAAASTGVHLIVLAGITAVMDEDDIIPRGIRAAGGEVEHFGLPVDPGHLLLLARIQDIPVMGAPGCVAGRGPDGVDLVLPRLLAGERLESRDLVALGHGGLRVR